MPLPIVSAVAATVKAKLGTGWPARSVSPVASYDALMAYAIRRMAGTELGEQCADG